MKHKEGILPNTEKTPNLSSVFFSSLSPTQQKQFVLIVGEYKQYWSGYYKFKHGTLKQSAFVYLLWDKRLWELVIKPSRLNKSMWLLLVLVFALKTTNRYKDKALTKKAIIEESGCMGTISRLRPTNSICFLEKHGYLSSTRLTVTKQKQYFITEKGQQLINNYSINYSKLFNDFFMPLETF